MERGIKANLEKIEVIIEIKSPNNLNKVQNIRGRIVELNRFMSKSTDKCLILSSTKKDPCLE